MVLPLLLQSQMLKVANGNSTVIDNLSGIVLLVQKFRLLTIQNGEQLMCRMTLASKILKSKIRIRLGLLRRWEKMETTLVTFREEPDGTENTLPWIGKIKAKSFKSFSME